MNAAQLLPAVRDLYSRDPVYRTLEAWELQTALYLLGYTNDLDFRPTLGLHRCAIRPIAGV